LICVKYPATFEEAAKAVDRTNDWAKQSKKCFKKSKKQLLFGIVQGSIYPELRKKSAQDLVEIGFDGYALGGLTLGEPIKKTYQIIKNVVQELPEDKPRYLMGAGKPEQIVQAVKMGIDMFDCVIPTRNARHGLLYVNPKSEIRNPKQIQNFKFQNLNKKFYKEVHITNAKYKNDFNPLDKNCSCFTCQNFSKAYLRHLFVSKEFLAQRLATIHNLHFYLDLMRDIRNRIKKGEL